MTTKFKSHDYVGIDTNIAVLADYIHGEICGCDDTTCTMPTEVYDWLHDGDPYGCTVQELVREALEYWADEE